MQPPTTVMSFNIINSIKYCTCQMKDLTLEVALEFQMDLSRRKVTLFKECVRNWNIQNNQMFYFLEDQ